MYAFRSVREKTAGDQRFVSLNLSHFYEADHSASFLLPKIAQKKTPLAGRFIRQVDRLIRT